MYIRLLLILPILFTVIVSCENYNFEEEFKLTGNEIPPFVYFVGSEESRSTSEGSIITFEVIPSYGVSEDITVTYSLTGTIIDNEEFEVVTGMDNQTIIEYDTTEAALDRGNIELFFPTDNETDGDKTFMIEIISATTESGMELEVGKGPGSLLTAIEVTVQDVDCESDLSGNYNAGNSCFETDSSSPVLEETDQNGVYNITDFTGGFYAFADAPAIPAVMFDKCGNLSIDDFTAFGVLEFTDMSGIVNEDGSLTLTWTESTGFGNNDNPVTCTTTFIPE